MERETWNLEPGLRSSVEHSPRGKLLGESVLGAQEIEVRNRLRQGEAAVARGDLIQRHLSAGPVGARGYLPGRQRLVADDVEHLLHPLVMVPEQLGQAAVPGGED